MTPREKPVNPAVNEEPEPKPGSVDVWPHVIAGAKELGTPEFLLADMQARHEMGIERYGTPLQTHNGRNPLVDAYQEALDLVVYLGQAELEGRLPPAASWAIPVALNMASALRGAVDAGR